MLPPGHSQRMRGYPWLCSGCILRARVQRLLGRQRQRRQLQPHPWLQVEGLRQWQGLVRGGDGPLRRAPQLPRSLCCRSGQPPRHPRLWLPGKMFGMRPLAAPWCAHVPVLCTCHASPTCLISACSLTAATAAGAAGTAWVPLPSLPAWQPTWTPRTLLKRGVTSAWRWAIAAATVLTATAVAAQQAARPLPAPSTPSLAKLPPFSASTQLSLQRQGADPRTCKRVYETLAAHPEIASRPAAQCRVIGECRYDGVLTPLERFIALQLGLSKLDAERPCLCSDDCTADLSLELCSTDGRSSGAIPQPVLGSGMCTSSADCTATEVCDTASECIELTQVGWLLGSAHMLSYVLVQSQPQPVDGVLPSATPTLPSFALQAVRCRYRV